MMKVLILALATVACVRAEEESANPIRKVVTLMQNMQKEIEAEGQKEEELFEKFMCYCGNSGGDLDRAAENSRTKVKELDSKLKAEEAEKVQVQQDLVQHKADREGAIADTAEATTIRAKEHAEFNELAADSKTNIAAMAGALPALEKGMGAASLMQLPGADRLHKLAETYGTIDDNDRHMVVAFLDQTGDYVPQSGQIVGILKQMKDEMESELKEATESEASATAAFEQLKASKAHEVKLATSQIETKTSRGGELAVAVVQTKDALQDEQEELAETEKFSAQLKAQCGTKQQEWDARQKSRSEEIAAISEAIKILNDDDALDTFKKTLPSLVQMPGSSFLQRRGGRASRATRAQAILAAVAAHNPTPLLKIALFQLTTKLRAGGRATNFNEMTQAVIKSVDNMIALLKKEQAEDDKQKDWCVAQFDLAKDEETAAKEKLADLTATVDEMSDSVAQIADEIATLVAENEALDKAVAEATEQRKSEHAEFTENLQMNTVAVHLVKKAKNALQKVYQPSLHKAGLLQKPRVISAEERILTAGVNLVEVSAVTKRDSRVAPPEAPETFSGSVKPNKSSAGVLGMMTRIIDDLDLQIQEVEHDEKTAQKDYAELMADSQTKRAETSKVITSKEAAKAVLETKLETEKESHRDAQKDLNIAQAFTDDLHMKCDFLMENHAARQAARKEEEEGLNNAKATLNGADPDALAPPAPEAPAEAAPAEAPAF